MPRRPWDLESSSVEGNPMKAEVVSAIREEGGELRDRCGRLRDHSRSLRLRSKQCRLRISRAAEGMENAAATLSTGQETDGAMRMDRLVQAESDLKAAIAECSAALAEVRRELEWRDGGPASIVH
jgi:hypothetical protein